MHRKFDVAGLRRRLLPAGSWRERAARVLLGPAVRRIRARRAAEDLQARTVGSPEPYVTAWEGPAQRMRLLPPSPRILLLKLDHIGDFVLSLAAFETLRQGFPDAHITLVCGRWAEAWAKTCGFFDRVVPFDFFPPRIENWKGATEATFRAYEALALGAFDLAVDLRHDADTRPLLARTTATFRAGYCAPPSWGGDKLDIALPNVEMISPEAGTGRPLHAGLRVAALASVVVASFARRNEVLAHRLCTGQLPEGLAPPYATFAPGAGSPLKQWDAGRMAKVAALLERDYGLAAVIVGGAGDKAAGATITAAVPQGRAHDLTGQVPLAGLPDVLAGARLHVGNDTGATHLAAALGVPTVAIVSGVPRPDVWQPVGARVRVVAGHARCAPCYKQRLEDCTFEVACLKKVEIAHIEKVCRELLAEQQSPGE